MLSMRRMIHLIAAACFLCSCEKKEQVVELRYGEHWDIDETPISKKCAACHAKEFNEWVGSDHAWAWRRVKSSDSEAFCGQELKAHGSTLRFEASQDRKKLFLKDAASGRCFEVDSVLGRTPLIQYLVKAGDGGLQAPSASWDVRKKEWFDMFEDDPRQVADGTATRRQGEWGHWLGRGLNWNSQCAWCHMTGFRKNYDLATDTYASTWQEPGVTCIQCHKLADHPDPEDGCLIARGNRKLTDKQHHDNCAACHARREEMDGDFCVGDSFDEHFRLELPLLPGIFQPNGMQLEEDYCETGMRLSRMGQAGVTCMDCHDPHSGRPILPPEDNSLCLRCHEKGEVVNGVAAPIASAEGEPCPAGTGGRVCVNCHMPELNYMARDPRRDHSFDIPDPVLSEELGIPNACNLCHKDKDVAWAANISRTHYKGAKLESRRPRTRAVHAALHGKGHAKDLLAVYRKEDVDAWRATLLELMARLEPDEEVLAAAREAQNDKCAMVRAAAARVLGAEAMPLTRDKSKLVRRAAAWPLAAQLLDRPEHSVVAGELQETAEFQADQPTGAMQLAMLASVRNDHAEAEKQYRRAIALDPASHVAHMDFAVFLARCHRPMDALNEMLAAARLAPGNADVQYRLALILAELHQYKAALIALDKALAADPGFSAAKEAKSALLQYLQETDPDSRK